jgi:hypothetical protein
MLDQSSGRWSKRLVDKVGSPPAKEESFTVLLDGPYSSPSLLGYKTVYSITGCSSIGFHTKLVLIAYELQRGH